MSKPENPHCSHDGCTNQKFLEISKDEKKCIFHCEKDDWYEQKNDKKIWNENLVKMFWEAIREYRYENNDYYSDFIFPEFERQGIKPSHRTNQINTHNSNYPNVNIPIHKSAFDHNFWKMNEEIIFLDDVIFQNCKFLGNVNFYSIKFSKDADFMGSIFEEHTNFQKIICLKIANFNNCHFKKNLDFSYSFFAISDFSFCHFSEKNKKLGIIKFERTIFLKEYNFSIIQSYGKVYFTNSCFLGIGRFSGNFWEESYFNLVTFYEEVKIEAIHFYNKIIFTKSIFKDKAIFSIYTYDSNIADFSSVEFSNGKLIMFSEEKSEHISQIKFQKIDFPETTKFRNCDLSNVSFLDSNIEKVHFENCHFSPKKDDEIIDREILFDQREVEKKKDATAEDFEKVENLYRQLKKNFDEKKDYQKADDFYVGEMEMMRRKLKSEQKSSFWIWFIIFFIVILISFSLLLYGDEKFIKITRNSFNKIGTIMTLFSYFLVYFLYFSIPSLLFSGWITKNKDHTSKLLILNLYKNISFYNSNPIQSIIVLSLLIWNFGMLYWYIADNFSFFNALGYSFSNSIPFVGDFLIKNNEGIIEPLKSYGLINFFVYPQKILSAGIILLFGLSLRRKFKR